MADTKISDMTLAAPLTGTEILPLVQAGANVQIAVGSLGNQLRNLSTLPVANGGTGVTTLTGYVKGAGTSALTASSSIPVADLSGSIGVANGGTGASSLTGYIKGSGASPFTASATIPRSDVSSSYGSFNSNGLTTLTASLTNSSTTPIAVTSTADFPSSGSLLCTSEIISYTGKTATTFTGITRARNGSTGATHTTGDNISFVSTTAALATATVPFSLTRASNGISLNTSTNEITVSVTGTYTIQFKGQIINCDNADDNAIAWILVNGVAIAGSTSLATGPAKTGTNNGTSILTVNSPFLALTAGDKITVNWSSRAGSTVLANYQPIPTGGCPYVPAAAFTINQVA